MAVVTIERQIAAAKRELMMRRQVYKKRVDAGKMNSSTAEEEIEAMGAIVATLELVQAVGVTATAVELRAKAQAFTNVF